MWWEIIVGSIIGAIFSVAITAFFERLRRPSLSMRIEKVPMADYTQMNLPRPAKKAQFLYVALVNNDLKGLEKWFSTRDAALDCHGVISFHRMDGTNIFGRNMVLRWINLPEPIPEIIVIDGKKGTWFDSRKVEHNYRINVNPGEEELFNIAARFDGEDDCYGWSNQSYLEPLWRNPDWKLSHGCFLVRVKITSSGNTCEGLFRLINDIPMKDFRLDPALPTDRIIS
jgi:hypothetical protein